MMSSQSVSFQPQLTVIGLCIICPYRLPELKDNHLFTPVLCYFSTPSVLPEVIIVLSILSQNLSLTFPFNCKAFDFQLDRWPPNQSLHFPNFLAATLVHVTKF